MAMETLVFFRGRCDSKLEMGAMSGMEALISLGRYPETGRRRFCLFLSLRMVWPADHNLKIPQSSWEMAFVDMLWHEVYRFRLVALSAGVIAIINPLVIQDINKLEFVR